MQCGAGRHRARLERIVILSEVEGSLKEPRITRLRTRLPPSRKAPARQDGGQAADVADSFSVIRSEVEKTSLLALIVCDTDLR